MTKSVQQALNDLGNLYEERNALYQNNYLKFGDMLIAMLPKGITLTTAEDFNRFALFMQLLHKLSRYAHNILKGGHIDSLDDMSVYAQMLQEFDGLVKDDNLKETWVDEAIAKQLEKSIQRNSRMVERIKELSKIVPSDIKEVIALIINDEDPINDPRI